MSFVLLFCLALLPALVVSNSTNLTVAVHQSINYQLPLVARVGQPYSWSFSPNTFTPADDSLRYTTSTLPPWLAFNDSTLTFQGTPGVNDAGYPEITVTAHAQDSSTSSRFTICVTSSPPPTLNLAVERQFHPNSSSLSSVFFLRPHSALSTAHPALRIPRKWSFSVGLESKTFLGAGGADVFYELRLANGSEIPEYMNFNSETVTLDGVIPPPDRMPQPTLVPLALHASDQEGYTSSVVNFDLVVADHELSLASSESSLPTINITTATPFAVSLLSAADFTGVLVDGGAIQPSNISALEIDVSGYDKWLKYDAPSRTLSGTPGGDVTGTTPLLPVKLTTIFNQTVSTNVSLALVESYFALAELPSLHVTKGSAIQTALVPYFSRSNAHPGSDGTNVTASYEPTTAANWLRFDELATNLTGTVPLDYVLGSDHVVVTFTAYSHITHSTSHTSLPIFIADIGNTKSLAPAHPSGLATAAHRKLVLAVVLTFGLIGGLCVLAGVFALVRRWARVEDTAVLGEEGRNALSEKDRRWYNMSPSGTDTGDAGNPASEEKTGQRPQMASTPKGPRPNYGAQGLGLGRVSEENDSEVVSPGVMSKREFLTKIKETVRQVSNKYNARKQRTVLNNMANAHAHANRRPVIGKPILVSSSRNGDDRESQVDPMMALHDSPSTTNPFEDSTVASLPGSTFMTGSPSTSTAEHSIPRRRADFAPPRGLAQVHFEDGMLVRKASTGSFGGNSSIKSGVTGESLLEPAAAAARPRLVPFTSSTRVPVPNASAGPSGQGGSGFRGGRIASQRAKVEGEGEGSDEGGAVGASGTSDELSMGIHYVRSLGADQLGVGGARSSPAPSNVRSSFTSLESSHLGHRTDAMKVLVRTGEKFKFKVPIASGGGKGRYYVKLASGQAVPKFVQCDLSGVGTKGVVEVWGVASARDMGEMVLGVYAEGPGACVGRVVIEVVGKR